MLMNVIVIVPGLPCAMPKLDVANTSFEQAASDESLPPMHARTVHRANRRGLTADIERVRCFHLHSIRQFERLDARFQPRVIDSAPLMFIIELVQKIELLSLLGQRGIVVSMYSINWSSLVCCVSM
jgi:hypothetical protein